MRTAAMAPTLSGRAAERAALLDAVRVGLDGSPRAVLVHGEAGIGKTSLVRSVCAQVVGEGAQVLWGQSLRFGAVEAMYHPLVLALEAWLGEADDAERASVVEAVPAAALILPSLGAPPPDSPSTLMTVVDGLLSRVVAQGPTVLVVDDVHWADPATWDALSYLVAGFAGQRMALLTTHRDEAAGSDLFQRWLGNLRRLPGTEELELARLDQDATGNQIATLLGRRPAPRLVEQVYERSGGNPYFSELLVRRGDLGSSELPDDLPHELSHALLDAWRGLSDPAREIARILAVAGRPTDLRTLAAIAAELGISQARSIREAVDAGVVVIGRQDAWFRHPLLADVLADSYLPGEAAPVHAAWARRIAAKTTTGIDELRRLGDLATHHEQAGVGTLAFEALERGAEEARKLGAHLEAADLLARATDLWDAGSPEPHDDMARARLLEQAGRACLAVERLRDGQRLLSQARDLVDPKRDPLWASRLTLALAGLDYHLGETEDSGLDDIETAVELSRADPNSREHAEALRALAHELRWRGNLGQARRVVEEAVEAAHRSGSAAALSPAYGTRSALALDRDLAQAERDAATSWEYALASGEPGVIGWAFIRSLWVKQARGDLRAVLSHSREMHAWGMRLGRVSLFPGVVLTRVLLDLGGLTTADDIVRRGLASIGNPVQDAMIRVAAAVLAMRRGADHAARDHVARAREILPHLEDREGMGVGPGLAEVLTSHGDAAGAFALIERVLPFNTIDARALDELTVWGARASADLVQRASDDRDQTAVQAHREALTRLVKTRATLPGIAFQPSGPDDTVQPARAALFAAESGRPEGVEDQVRLWREAVAACATAGLGWEEQTGSWRLAAALIESGAPGTEAAELLRSVHDYADRQGAAPLKARVEELAASARISLATPHLPPSPAAPAAFTALTARETEVLAHLVANRTNAEIAQALFISEKTVSVHVSNLLRKTETGSRREVAALARRVGWGIGG